MVTIDKITAISTVPPSKRGSKVQYRKNVVTIRK
jgi:hypothetical protein